MMRKVLGGVLGNVLGSALGGALAAASAVSMISAARATDVASAPYYTAPAPVSAYSWIGPYIGGTLGYEWGTVDNNPTRPNGVAGGFEAGFNWQHGNFVYGAEADIQLSSAINGLPLISFGSA